MGEMNRLAPLWSICSFDDDLLSDSTSPEFSFNYVDISNVETGCMAVPSQTVTFAHAPSRARRLAQPGDVAISTVRTYLRAIAPVPEDTSNLVFSTGFCIVRPLTGTSDGRFVNYLLTSNQVVDEIVADSTGTSYPATSATKISRLRVPAPPLSTQRKIADYLDHETAEIDGMRADLDEMERLLTERRKSAIASMVRGEKSESGRDSFRCFPKIKLDRVTSAYQPKTISQEKMNSDGRFHVYGANGLIGRYQDYNHKDSEVTVACRGATCGAVNITAPYSWITGNAMVVKPLTQFLNKKFMRYALEMSDYALIVSGSAQPQITRESLYKLEIPLPPLTDQRRIADEIDRETAEIDSMLADIKELRNLLAERRAAIISAAVTGQIDIPASPTTKD